jgi:histone H3/H4
MPVSSLRNGKMIIKVSDVKDVVGDRFRISEEFYGELDREVHEMIERAARRAKRNGRKTLKPYDL